MHCQDLLSALTLLDDAWQFWTAQRSDRPYIRPMKRILSIAVLAAASIHHAHCQQLAKSPAFEVASITPCKPGTPEPMGEHMGMMQFIYPGGRFEAKAIDIRYLFEWAYKILPSQHSDGPAWFGSDRYDIIAKAPGNATDAEIRLMTQALLADRFKLKLHRETKEVSVLAIGIGKNGAKLPAPKDGEIHSIQVVPRTGPDPNLPAFHVEGKRFTMAQLIDTFARQFERVMVDQTGIDGEFDFSMDLNPDEGRPSPLHQSILIEAMQDQLGLSLKSMKAPVDVYVIDSAEKAAAGND